MKNCECDTPGYCKFFNKEMGENPPHWKWCQNANESERIHYKTVCDLKHKSENTNKNPPSSGEIVNLVDPVSFNDELPTKTNKVAVCVIAANEYAEKQLNITRPTIVKYANKVNADYIELTGDQFPKYPMFNKYRLSKVLHAYDCVLYLDCDVVIRDNCPNLFETFNKKIAYFVDEWSIMKNHNSQLYNGMNGQRKQILKVFPHLKDQDRDIEPNGGVMLIHKEVAHRYHQPSRPYPKIWCFDQDYFLLNLQKEEYSVIDWRYNLEFVDYDFWSKLESSYIIHLNGSRPTSYRLELLHRMVDENFEFFPQPKKNTNEPAFLNFRPLWRNS
jgi:hypothetical protein